MAIQITIAGTTYDFPESGESPNWGAQATETIVAMANAINTLLGPGDILQTSSSISNNISLATAIDGLIFDSSITRAANIYYSVYRISDANPSDQAEVGKIFIVYDDNATIGSKWKITRESNGDSGVVFSINDLGQVFYTSSDISSTGYDGTISFSAKCLSR